MRSAVWFVPLTVKMVLGLLHENAVLAIMLELVALFGEMTVPRATGGEKARFVRS